MQDSSGQTQSTPQPIFNNRISQENEAEKAKNISASPAAMFLSAFSSPPVSTPKPDDAGQVISGYTLGPIIGYGASSIIRKATSESGGQVAAVKIIRRSDLVKAGNAPQARKKLQHEAAVWSTLSHEHILPLFSAVHTQYADYFFTLYCPAGSLFDILKQDGNPALPQDDAGMMFRQVVRGLRYLHEVVRYVHRDMKLENVLVDEQGVCRIGDFGMTRKIGASDSDEEDDYEAEAHHLFHHPHLQHPNSALPTFGASGVQRAVSFASPSPAARKAQLAASHHAAIGRHNSARHRNSTSNHQPVITVQPGSLPYAAPELLLPQTSDAMRPHPGQDIWALGVMLYALLTGRLPFNDSFEPRLQMKILNGVYTMPTGIGRGAERLLQGCLERSPSNRWNIAMVDDVAWGVGWGAEGDGASPSEILEEMQWKLEHGHGFFRGTDGADDESLPTPSHSPSRSRSRHHSANNSRAHSLSRSSSRMPKVELAIPASALDWDQDSHPIYDPTSPDQEDGTRRARNVSRTRHSINTAARRSSSRQQRSLSRAPVLTDKGSAERSQSRGMRSQSRGLRRNAPGDTYLRPPVTPSRTSPSRSSTSDSFIQSSGSSSPSLVSDNGDNGECSPTWSASESLSSSSSAFVGLPSHNQSTKTLRAFPDTLHAERGRRRVKASPSSPQDEHNHTEVLNSESRSPSPSSILRTPLDGTTLRCHHPTDVIGEVDEELHLDDGESRSARSELEGSRPDVAVRDGAGFGLGIDIGMVIGVDDLGDIVRGTERLSVSPHGQLDAGEDVKKPGKGREVLARLDNPPSGLSLAMAGMRNES
ncbi:hypothetical protein CVT24_004523 [Panaeolus cyanescens]|uniref:Protein kinase domain-containing protein n=1 Tax=Panaeolus cyanescens TaxID=181874 RepID=A0A409YBT2_9AGAR|nr:hypothetical protein CVT24_004523 [Panaeolus cyanescens]